MYVKNFRELIEYIITVFREKRFWFSVKYVFWVLWDKMRGLDYVKNEGYDKLHTTPEESAVYQATRDIRYLDDVLSDMKITPEDSILDLGCGKGYLLKYFSKKGFKRVGGVEISRKLSETARNNLYKEQIRNFEIYNENAITFNKYEGYNYIYMFNPFPGPVMKAVMQNIENTVSHGWDICIIYHNPVCHNEVIASGRFRLIKRYRGKSTEYYVYKNK